MKILIISKYFWPERFLISDIAQQLAKNNEVTVMCPNPNYFYKGNFSFQERASRYSGIKFINFRIPIRRNLISYIFNDLFYVIKSKHIIKHLKEKFDIVYVYQLSPISICAPAVKFCKQNKIPLFIYSLDLWPESAKSKLGSFKFLYSYIKKKSKSIYQFADRVGITSPKFRDYFVNQLQVDNSKIVYIPQHITQEAYSFKSNNETNKTIFTYIGNLGAGQNVLNLVKAFNAMSYKSECEFRIVGTGSKFKEIKKYIEKNNINTVKMYGQMSREETITFYSETSALLISLRGDNAVGSTLPGKMQTYMMAGKPIFGCANGSIPEVIKEADCGECVPSDDYISLSKILDAYFLNKEKYKKSGLNAREYAEKNFSLDRHIRLLERELLNLYEVNQKKF